MNSETGYSQPHLGATFYPGGADDFYIPEVVSPAPQRCRSMPEVPQQIQDNLAHFELDASSPRSPSGPHFPELMHPSQISNRASHNNNDGAPPRTQSSGAGNPKLQNNGSNRREPSGRRLSDPQGVADQPSFSPFPQLRNRPPNVPPSDGEKEAILENAREAVLHSNDPEMQLTWAQDALSYVEIAMGNEARMSELQDSRSRTPRIEHQLRVDAVNVVTFLADQHHPKAEFLRGTWLEFGKLGFRMDKKEAYRCYSRAAQGGYIRAEYRIGMQFENSNDAVNAIKHFSLGLTGHDSASNYRLGMMALLGQHGQPQDYQRGIEMIRFSAETADENAPQGAFVYGMLQARELPQVSVPEQFLPLDMDSALYNIEKAAYLGFAKAQTKMGLAYELCQLGCEFDPTLSLHYNNLAARQGDPEAEMAISKWFLCGHEGTFKKNEEMAFSYAQRAAQTGLPTAEFALGYFYEIGIHVPVSIKDARVWYSRAAEHGNKDAAARIEGITRSKTLSRKDHEKIAVAKINSVRASRLGNRPQRLTRPPMPAMPEVPPMPQVPYGTVRMPDIESSFQGYANHGPYSPQTPTSSYAGSAYIGSTNPQPKPQSLNHYNSPSSAAATNTPPANGRYGMTSSGPIAPQRPYSATPDPVYGFGRGGMTPRPGPSTPKPPSNSQGYRRSSEGVPPGPVNAQPGYDARQKPLPQVQLGFTAPPDPSGADRKKRPQRSDNPVPGYQTAGRANIPHPARASSRPPVVPQGQFQGNEGRVQSPHLASSSPAVGSRPLRNELQSSRPAAGPSVPSTPVPTAPSISTATPTPSASGNPGGRRPGKGPSTFEEMGVPQGKKEDDCAIDISANLHNKVSKSSAVKVLKDLHEQNLIAGKAAGKQIVYHALQDPNDAASPEVIAAMDREIAHLREEIATARGEERILKANLTALNATMSTQDIRASLVALGAQKKEILSRLNPLRSGSVKPVSPQEKAEVDQTWRLWSSRADTRKKICMEVWAVVTEEVPEGKTKEELWEEYGLEGDS
ncbi:hypothetical protein MMC17_005311 [Xylographa soralifera]|nr:hypothetical protein [Xylographa soralifera]